MHAIPLGSEAQTAEDFQTLDEADLDMFVMRRIDVATLPIVLTAPHGGWPSFGGQSKKFMLRPDSPGEYNSS